MGGIYGGPAVPVLGLLAGCDCMNNAVIPSCNNTSVCDPNSICYNLTLCHNATLFHTLANNVTGCVSLQVAHPWHLVALLPFVVGGFALSNMGIRGMKLWTMEAYDWIMRR